MAIVATACVWMCGVAQAQQGTSIAAPAPGLADAPGFPDTPSSLPPGPAVGMGGRAHMGGMRDDDSARPQRPRTGNPDHFEWGQFLTDATRAGVRLAVPRLQQGQVPSLTGGYGMPSGPSTGYAMAGGSMGGRANFMDVGSGLLRSLGDSTGGALGSTLHTLSGLTDSRSGYALSSAGSGVDFHVTGSLGNLMGGSMPGGGQGGGGMSGGGLGGANGLGGHGQAGHGGGPSLSLKLKF